MTDSHPTPAGANLACPDVEAIADFHAGALDETESARIAAHVATDARCQAVLDALDATVAQLRSMPPVTMPEHFARRLNAAIAAEAGREAPAPAPLRAVRSAPPTSQSPVATQPSAPTHQPPSGVIDLASARKKRGNRSAMLVAAAAAAILVGGGAIVATQSGGDTNVADETSQNNTFEETEQPDANNDAQVLGFGSPSDVLDKGEIVNDEVDPEIAGEMAETQKRNQCVAAIPDRPVTPPEAVQQGQLDGQDAYAFVFATEDDDTVMMIVVNAEDCSDVLDRVEGDR